MSKQKTTPKIPPSNPLAKSPTGIAGLDEITNGGLPTGRPTLVCGNAGCGKTLLGLEFLVRGVLIYNEPGVFMTFEETEGELAENVSSLGFELDQLVLQKKIVLDHVQLERSEIELTGEFDLEALFIRLNYAIEIVGAKRVVLDAFETLFSGLPNQNIVRSELRRLFQWLKSKKVTAIVTGERGRDTLTKRGIEEYISDCVILLDNRIEKQACTRRLRIVKYRGTAHSGDEYPFLIEETGFSVLPLSAVGLNHTVSADRVPSGIPRLDTMLGNKGFYRGSSILISGTAGSGKSSLAAHFTQASCQRGEAVLYFAFEESARQIIRNMRSIGIDLEPWVKEGLLKFCANRPSFFGMESHLTYMLRIIGQFAPKAVVVDPASSFISGSNELEANSMLVRLIDGLKQQGITAFMTNLTNASANLEKTQVNISSIIDTWLLLRDIEDGGERNRGLYILKSRGMAHSNQIREFLLTPDGVQLLDVYLGPGGVLTGTARLTEENREKVRQKHWQQDILAKHRVIEAERKVLEAKIEAIQLAFKSQEEKLLKSILFDEERLKEAVNEKKDIARQRRADENGTAVFAK